MRSENSLGNDVELYLIGTPPNRIREEWVVEGCQRGESTNPELKWVNNNNSICVFRGRGGSSVRGMGARGGGGVGQGPKGGPGGPGGGGPPFRKKSPFQANNHN